VSSEDAKQISMGALLISRLEAFTRVCSCFGAWPVQDLDDSSGFFGLFGCCIGKVVSLVIVTVGLCFESDSSESLLLLPLEASQYNAMAI
jgi:hypothetical protein